MGQEQTPAVPPTLARTRPLCRARSCAPRKITDGCRRRLLGKSFSSRSRKSIHPGPHGRALTCRGSLCVRGTKATTLSRGFHSRNYRQKAENCQELSLTLSAGMVYCLVGEKRRESEPVPPLCRNASARPRSGICFILRSLFQKTRCSHENLFLRFHPRRTAGCRSL